MRDDTTDVAVPTGTRSVELRPVRPGDVDWLYDLLVCERGGRWRYRGRTPDPAEFAADLWKGVFSQYVVRGADGAALGLVGLYNVNAVAATGHLFAVASASAGPLVTEGAGALVNWAFDHLEARKLWIEVAESNLGQFARLADVAEIEGRLTDFDYWQGRYWDHFILSIARQRWDEALRPLVERRTLPIDPLPSAASGAPAAQLEPLLAELLPLDSLGAVELLATIEEQLDAAVPPEVVTDLPDDPRAAAACIAARLGPPQQCGARSAGSPGKGHEPSSVMTSQSS